MKTSQDFHIVVVDDNTPFRESFQKMLLGMGYRVHGAGNGQEALSLLSQEPADLVFTDLQMPVISGMELLKKVKQLYPQTHVVLMTVHSELAKDADALDFQASGYLTKPIKRQEIVAILEQFCSLEDEKSQKNN